MKRKLSILFCLIACIVLAYGQPVLAAKDKDKDKKEVTSEEVTSDDTVEEVEQAPVTEDSLKTTAEGFSQYYFQYKFEDVIAQYASTMDPTTLGVYQVLADAQATYTDYGEFQEIVESTAKLDDEISEASVTILTTLGKKLIFNYTFDASGNISGANVMGIFAGSEVDDQGAYFNKEDLKTKTEAFVKGWFSYDFKKARKTFKDELSKTSETNYEEYAKLQKEYGDIDEEADNKVKVVTDEETATVTEIVKTTSGKKLTFTVIYDENSEISSWKVEGKKNLGKIMGRAGLNVLLGMGIVFAVLLLIAFVISMFGVVFGEKSKKAAADKGKSPRAKKAEVISAVQGGDEEEEENLADDLELVAVIAAAIAASEGRESTDGLVVRSIRRR
ncbi:MAG: OadG family protein [Lachnospiraceae bacterium]|nr:OadG family protein [Lachnospiraceae bacterium]